MENKEPIEEREFTSADSDALVISWILSFVETLKKLPKGVLSWIFYFVMWTWFLKFLSDVIKFFKWIQTFWL